MNRLFRPRLRRTTVLVAALLAALVVPSMPAAAAPVAPVAARAARPSDPIAHDPTIVREGGWYYVSITGDAARPDTFLPLKRSRDLLHWQEIGPVFTKLPSWIASALGVKRADAPKDLWAPDLSYSHGEWRLYYAASVFGKNTSAIGLATTPTLNPDSPRYGWRDEGLVVRSTDYREPDGDSYNAIDPSITTDAAGRTWLSFGSFFSGVYLHRIDAKTGEVRAGDVPRHIAERAAPDAEENATIVHHGGYYYLFLSFDNCCRGVEGDYRTVVARSKSIAGPYLDRSGVPMLNDKGGTELMRGYNEFVGAGGADVLLAGRDLVVNHYYDATDEGAPKLNVRRLRWDADGWPRASEPMNASRSAGHGDAYVAIRPFRSDLAVGNAGCEYEGADIALTGGRARACEQWQLSDRGRGTRITNRFSNQVAEIRARENVDGGGLTQQSWLGVEEDNDGQRWSFLTGSDGTTTISSLRAGARSWTVGGDPATAGTEVVLGRPVTGAAQRFRFQPVGRVLLGSPTDTRKVFGVAGGRVKPQSADSKRRQAWRFESVRGTAAYRVVSAADGRWLVGTSDGLRAVAPRRSAAPAGRWTIAPTNDGTWSLRSGSIEQRVRLVLP